MSTQLFLTSLVVQATATLFLFLVFLVLYRHSRQLYFAYWTAGWGVLGLGVLALALFFTLGVREQAGRLLPALYHWSIAVTALLVLFARHAFATGRPVPRWTWVVFVPACAWLLASAAIGPGYPWRAAALGHLLFALGLWASGNLFHRVARRERRPGAWFLALCFGAWGLQQALYAIAFVALDQHAEYLAWIGLADTLLTTFVALGMIRFALDEDRGRLLEAARRLVISEQRLQELAMRDPLTGLFNRRHFDHVAPQMESQAQRLGFPVAVVIVDLNFFKETNDRHGHQRGDQVLRVFAEFLRRETRASDLPFRWGGDEFLLLMVGLSTSGVEAKVEALRAAWDVVRHELESEVTLALGWALLDADGLEAAIRRADRGMYRDKRARRRPPVPVV